MIRLDDEIARLLDARFELTPGPGGLSLARERGADEPARTLLGKPTMCVGRDRDLAVLEATESVQIRAARQDPC